MQEKNPLQQSSSIFVVSRVGFLYFVLILITGATGFFVLNSIINNTIDGYQALVICSIVAVAIMVGQFIALYKYSGSFGSNYLIFVIAFIVFHFGLFFVYAFGADYNYFYLKSYDINIVLKTLLFEYLCAEMLFLAASNINRIQPLRFSRVNCLDEFSVFKLSKQFMILTGIVAFLLLGIKIFIFLHGYYEGVRTFESNVPSVIGLIEYFFIPFSILTWIYSEDINLNRIIKYAIIIWSVITALCGDRTSGIAGIIMVVLIETRFKNKSNNKHYIFSFLVLIGVMILSVFIKSFREGSVFNSTGIVAIFSDFLGELGSSYFPVTLIMRVCPSIHPYLMGKSYLFSILSGLLPASIDFTGIVNTWVDLAMEPVSWIKLDYDYSFGTGYSLCAEAYANFGWAGFLILFVIALIIIKLLTYDYDNKFSTYTSSILMFEFFTLSRRNSYYIFNHLLYCVVFISILLILFIRQSRHAEV